jgi:cytoskeletal protein RodZ
LFKATKLTRNFVQSSLFKPLGHSRQFFVGAVTATGLLGVVAFGLMTKSSIEVHLMPEKATDTSVEAQVSPPNSDTQEPEVATTADTPVGYQQAAPSQSIPSGAVTPTKTTPVTNKSSQAATSAAKQASQPATPASIPKPEPTTVDLSTLGVHVATGVKVPL